MTQEKKGLVINIGIYDSDLNLLAKKESHNWEGATEDLGKLERLVEQTMNCPTCGYCKRDCDNCSWCGTDIPDAGDYKLSQEEQHGL